MASARIYALVVAALLAPTVSSNVSAGGPEELVECIMTSQDPWRECVEPTTSCSGAGIHVRSNPLVFDASLGLGGLSDDHGVMTSPNENYVGYFRLFRSSVDSFEYLFVGRAPGCAVPLPCPWPHQLDPIIEDIEDNQPPEWPWTLIFSTVDEVTRCLGS